MAENNAIQDTRALRAFLTGKLNDVADGKIDKDTTNGISNIAQQIYNTLNIEVKTAVAMSKLGVEKVEPVKF